jgi:hypothetical protein
MQFGADLFERAASARARLLRAERIRGERPGATGLALTFDAGVITIEPAADGGGLRIAHPEPDDAAPAATEPLDQEEPWWRFLGNPLTGCAHVGDATSPDEVHLRFREPEQGARSVVLVARGTAVAAALEPE